MEKKSYNCPEISFYILSDDVVMISVPNYQDDPFGDDILGGGF